MKKDFIKLVGDKFPSESDIRNGKLTDTVLQELDKVMDDIYQNTNKYAQFADECIPKTVKNDKLRKKVDNIFDKIMKELKQVQEVVSKVETAPKSINVVEPILDPLMVYKERIIEDILNNGKRLRSSYDQLMDLYDKYDEEYEHLVMIKDMYVMIVKIYEQTKEIENDIKDMEKNKSTNKLEMKKEAVKKLKEVKNQNIAKLEEEISEYGKRIKMIRGIENQIVNDFDSCVNNIVKKELKELDVQHI
jgi:hypothetical protein